MIRLLLATIPLIATLVTSAVAQERVTVGTQRLVSSGALFIAATNGYFKAEGVDIQMRAYPTARNVVEALAGGAVDVAVADFTAAAFDLAGKGSIKAIAAQVREKRDHEGDQIVASNAGYARGLRKSGDIAGRSFAVTDLGTNAHYEIGQMARVSGADLDGVVIKPMQSIDAVSRAVAAGDVDGAILPAQYAKDLLTSSQGKLVGWVSAVDEPQLGAVFASGKMLGSRRAAVEKFLRAYQHGAAGYAAALLRHDKYSKRVNDAKSQAAAAAIARYVYPDKKDGVALVESGSYYMDAQARLDVADIERRVEWYKAQTLIGGGVAARNVIDTSFQ
jgi:NitT/TauT family transport system substrate-binding protein